jgi:hypothetical protein
MSRAFIALSLLAVVLTVGCSETTNITNPPTPSPVDSVAISPKSVEFGAIAETKQFTANAYDENGGEISASFTWTSSQEEVVIVGSGGLAAATGPGNAKIYVTAGGVSDSATVLVNAGGITVRIWASGVSGDWEDPTKWVGGEVPNPGDVVQIDVPGDYAVTMNEDVEVSALILGDPTVGTPTLATGTNTLTIGGGSINGSAQLEVLGTAKITGLLAWRDGDVRGTGTVEVERGAELVIGSPGASLDFEATLLNRAVTAVADGTTLWLRSGSIDNRAGALFDFRGDAIVIVSGTGSVIQNDGSILKSAGAGLSKLDPGSGEFATTGAVEVQAGTLELRHGTWRGRFDVAAGAQLDQSGSTTIDRIETRGDGAIRFTGDVTLNQFTDIGNLILDAFSSGRRVSGPGSLQCFGSLVWRQGTFSEMSVFLFSAATMRFEGSGFRGIEKTEFQCAGKVDGGGLNQLTLSDGAELIIRNTSRWVQNGAGTIAAGTGESSMRIEGTFEKKGTGAFIIEPATTCVGSMVLLGAGVVIRGDFQLGQQGTISGGGTGDLGAPENRVIIVQPSGSLVLAGTIAPGVDDELRRIGIQGVVSIQPTFRAEVDVRPLAAFSHEALIFETGRVELDGTLEVKVASFPPEQTQYRVVSTQDGTGKFHTITGVGVFTTVQEDQLGVLLIR